MSVDENSPIYKAIDRGGGQTCDIKGVLRELDAYGYVIVPKEPTQAMLDAPQMRDYAWRNEDDVTAEHVAQAWREMIRAFTDRAR